MFTFSISRFNVGFDMYGIYNLVIISFIPYQKMPFSKIFWLSEASDVSLISLLQPMLNDNVSSISY